MVQYGNLLSMSYSTLMPSKRTTIGYWVFVAKDKLQLFRTPTTKMCSSRASRRAISSDFSMTRILLQETNRAPNTLLEWQKNANHTLFDIS